MWIVTGLTMQLLASAAPIPPCGVDWVIGDVVAQPVWNSGETESLSPWKSVDCSAFGPQYTLASITVNREPKKNLDRFVARLTATCREFLPRCQAGAGAPATRNDCSATCSGRAGGRARHGTMS